jgi:21S rRNA (uridine2791-2'-O)-methyltransferase
VDNEAARKLRVECQIFETDNELLRLQCERLDNDAVESAQLQDSLNQQLLHANDEIKSLQSSLRMNNRTMQGIKVCYTLCLSDCDTRVLNCSQGDLTKNHKSSDYEQISADKLALSKEISALKLEIGHLKNQTSSYQTLVSEKQALERQLNSFEIQMEDERRAFERNKANGSTAGDETRRQLKSLQEELKNEIEDKRRLEKEEREKSAAWENEKKALEERLQTVRKQLRNAKDKLKEYRESESNPHILSRPSQGRQSSLSQRDSSLGHSINSFDADMTIATPGAIRTTADPKRQIAAPGEKSTFSITPYLNRNKPTTNSPNTWDEDLEADSDQQHRIEKKQNPSKSSSRVDSIKGNKKAPKKADGKNRRKADDEEEASEDHEANNRGEESLDEDTTLPGQQGGARVLQSATASKAPQEGKQPQRKRKILGGQRDKTLFDDEDDDLERPTKDRRLTSTLHSGIQALRASRQTFNEKSNFSPLKRTKRLV